MNKVLAAQRTFSSFPPSSSVRPPPFIAKCRMLQGHSYPYPNMTLLYSSRDVGKAGTVSPLKLKNSRFSCSVATKCSNVETRCHVLSDSYTYTTVWPNSRLGFLSFSSNPGLSSTLVKRCFSTVPRALDKNEAAVKDGPSGKGSWVSKSFKGRNKNSRAGVVAAAAAQGKNVGSGNSSAVVSSEELVGDAKTSKELGGTVSNAKGKQKKQSQGKKPKEQPAGGTTSKEVSAGKDSKSTSKAKKSSKSGKSSVKNSKNEPSATTVAGPHDTSASTKKEIRKKPGNLDRRDKTIVETKSSLQKAQETCGVKHYGKRPLKPLYPPTGKSVLVVESATKAKVIQGYLGDEFEVLPSYGHVRDLAGRSGSVRPDDDFSMVWEVPSSAWTHLKGIKVALNGAENLILASDPDREGEAIAWHIIEMLQQQDALREDITVARVVFHEITESSVKKAMQAPREIDVNLVHAYLARRALDYLIGFNISPLLWRNLPGCQSAGRVQSAALSLVCDREMEIDEFKAQEYWSVGAKFEKKQPEPVEKITSIPSQLTHIDFKKLNQFSVTSQSEADDIEKTIKSDNFHVSRSKRNKMRRNPPNPYITSTLQQDAVNKLNFSTAYTMKLAQKLYEGVQLSDGKAAGLITYMRTDGLHISSEAGKEIRSLVVERYGLNYATESPRKFFKKVKNAQEAHEAIRPTNIWRLPSMLASVLDEDLLKLYTLIWSRSVACQMEPSTIDQVQIDIGNVDGSITFRSSCSRVGFLGYQAVYEDTEAEAVKSKDKEVNSRNEAFEVLNSLKEGDPLHLGETELNQHCTQPPPRYSEGSLIKKLEELGIGRPSTYASTLKVLQDRNYVTVKSRVLHPEFRGRMVSAFLSDHFSEVTDYSFTADMETELDNVSAGLTEWKGLLRDYWTRFISYCERASSVHIHQVEKMLEKKFGNFLFASLPGQSRLCPSCSEGNLIFKVSRFGAGYFIGCDQHPKCKYIAKTLYGEDDEEDTPQKNNDSIEEPRLIGLSPESNEKVLLKNGPYGFYIQLGEDRTGYSPKRASIPFKKNMDSITLEEALDLLRYPVTLGDHPKDGQPVIIKLAKLGFTVKHRRTIASLPKNLNPKDVTLEKALELLSGDNVRRSGRPKNKPKVEDAIEAF